MQRSNANFEFQEGEEVTLADSFYTYISYWPVFLLLLLITLSGAWLFLRYKLPVYETTATLLIKDDQKNAGADELLDAFDMFGSKKNVENEVEVLQSKTLMREVVENLHLYAPVTVEARVLSQSGYLLSPIVIEAKYLDSLKNIKKIYFNYDSKTQSVNIDGNNFSLNQWENTKYGIFRFLPNKYYKNNGENGDDYEYYFSLSNVKNTANQISSQITVAPSSKQSTVIDLSIQDEVAQRGEDVLNELLKVYNRAAILDKNLLAANTLKFVNERLSLVENDLDSVENKLQHFKAKNRITDISAQGQIYLQTVSANDEKISDINVQLAMLGQVESYVNDKGNQGGIVPATIGVADPELTGLLQRLSDLELKYAQTKKIVPENNPAVVAIQEGIYKLKPGILENIHSQRKNLLAARNDLTSRGNEYVSMLKTIPEKERELLGISRQQAIKSNIYTFLLQKREETALSFASAVADSRIIDRAQTSDSPVSPKKDLIYLAAVLGAILLGVAIIYLKDILTRTVQDKSDIGKYTDMPILGEVVYDWSKSPFVIAEGKRSFIAEQFRQIRTSLSYMGVDEAHKRIMITSSITGEGKSFIAVNLGISLSLMDKKVVLIELDLRKPKLSEQLNVSRQRGLSTYLIGKTDLQDIIINTEIENLSLIPSGPIPPNPSELISNIRLKELLTSLDGKFDYIIIDTAPVNPVTDAFILSPLCDVSLFVVRDDYTPKVFLEKLEEKLHTNSLKNPAIIYNGIRGKGFSKYGYGYGYKYGYGYTDDKTPNQTIWRRIFNKK